MLCLGTLLLALSCTKEMEPEKHPAMPETPCRVTFRIETEPAEGIVSADLPDTRISRPIRDVNFYVYGDRGLLRSGYTASAFVPTMTLTPGSYRIYVIANAGRSLERISEAELLRYTTPVTAADGFVQDEAMYLSGMQTITVAGPATCRIVLRRLAAKIDLNVRIDDALEGARIVHVVPGNVPARCALFADNRLNDASEPQVSYPYRDLTASDLRSYAYSYYGFENLAGSVASITDPADRIDGKAPATASYVSIRIRKDNAFYDYKVYLGGGDASNFDVRRNTSYRYEITIFGTNPADLRLSKTEIIFWAGNNVTIGGKRYQDGFFWSTRVAYAELNILTENCDPNEEYTLSFRKLSGTFHMNWQMQYMVISLPSGMREYLPLYEGQKISVRKGNGRTAIMFAFSNYSGTQNHNTTDNYFEFTVRNKKGDGRTVVLSTNMDEWFK